MDAIRHDSCSRSGQFCTGENAAICATSNSRERRCIIQSLLIGCIVTNHPVPGRASDESGDETDQTSPDDSSLSLTSTKPFASLESLLPAARVKRVIDQCVALATELNILDVSEYEHGSPSDETTKLELQQQLQEFLLKPQNYTRSTVDTSSTSPKYQPAKTYLDSYKRNMEKLNLLEKPGGLLVQSGEIDTWKRLKRQEREKEQEDGVREAFNAYTNNLSFSSESFKLNVPKEQRSRMIRENALPDVKNVIASDMGMRYLYRNEILTGMEDARAELWYQMKRGDEFDATELLDILLDVQESCSRWFSLIDESYVRDALDAVAREEDNIRTASHPAQFTESANGTIPVIP